MSKKTAAVIGHYGVDDLVDRILRALTAAGHDTSSPTVEMLNLADQMHGGGLNATKVQAKLAGITGDMRVLDAGCGIGGSSRYLAHTLWLPDRRHRSHAAICRGGRAPQCTVRPCRQDRHARGQRHRPAL